MIYFKKYLIVIKEKRNEKKIENKLKREKLKFSDFIILLIPKILTAAKVGIDNKKEIKANIERLKKLKIYINLIPEINTIEIQVPTRSIDWPISGWFINKIIIDNKIRKLKKYKDIEVLLFSRVNIFAVNNIKIGLISSIGCSLKKNKSNHLFEPLTSTPIIGTNNKAKKRITNKGKIAFFKKLILIKETNNIINKAAKTNIKCLEKKK